MGLQWLTAAQHCVVCADHWAAKVVHHEGWRGLGTRTGCRTRASAGSTHSQGPFVISAQFPSCFVDCMLGPIRHADLPSYAAVRAQERQILAGWVDAWRRSGGIAAGDR